MKYTRICKICNKEFQTNQYNQIACSPQCRAKNKYLTAKELNKLRYYSKPNKARSLCFSCSRAYAKPFEKGGCDKVLNGTKIYNKAHWVFKEPDRKGYWVLVVDDCDYFKPERSN